MPAEIWRAFPFGVMRQDAAVSWVDCASVPSLFGSARTRICFGRVDNGAHLSLTDEELIEQVRNAPPNQICKVVGEDMVFCDYLAVVTFATGYTVLAVWKDEFKRRVQRSGATVSVRDLLIGLNELTVGTPKDLKHWPASPEALAHRLVRLAPVLRAHGIEVKKLPRTMNARSRWQILRDPPQGYLFPRCVLPDLKEAA